MSQAVQRALHLLETLNRRPETACGLGEIAAATGLTAPTCARLLKTLVETGYAEQLGPKKGYRLGPMAYSLGAGGPYRKDIALRAQPVVAAAAAELGENVLVATVVQGRWLVLCEADGERSVVARQEGYPPLEATWRTATGRTVVAWMEPLELEAFVARSGLPDPEAWPDAHGPGGLESALARTRERGMGWRENEDVVAMGFPVRQNGRVVAAVGCQMPRYRYETDHGPLVRERLRRDAEVLSERLSADAAPAGTSAPAAGGRQA